MVNRGQREQPKPDDERWPEEKRRTSTTKTPNYDWDHHHLYLVANSFLLHYCSQYKSNILAGRRHENVQTEIYLEELFVTPPVSDVCTQTDLFVERPISPFYVPAKTGADVETQIYPGDVSHKEIIRFTITILNYCICSCSTSTWKSSPFSRCWWAKPWNKRS